MPEELKSTEAVAVKTIEEKQLEAKQERERKDQEVCAMIASANGRQLWSFMGKLKKTIGGGSVDYGNNSKYLRLCTARAKELNKDRYGDWEHAKVEVNHMPEPQGIYKSESLLPVLGYPCDFVYGKTRQIVLINPKLNVVYIRELGSGDVSYTTAKKIFSS